MPINIMEVINKHDPCAQSSQMREAVFKEVRELLIRGTFKVILKEELPDGANVLTASFV